MNTRDFPIADAGTLTLAAETDVTFRMDEDAFRGFYDRTSRVLWAYLRRLTNDRTLADDLLQECYYRFLRAEVELESESHRRHYLFKIATNLVRDGARRTNTRPPIVPHDDEVSYDHRRAHGHEAVTARVVVNEALSQLGAKERALLWLAYAQGASHQEIAAVVGVKTTSVKSLLYRARRRMAGLLRHGATRRHEVDVVLRARSRRARTRLDESVAGASRLRRSSNTCASCDVCRDLATVASAMSDLHEATAADVKVPDASVVWYRAQVRARQELARRAARPVAAAQAAAALVGLGGAFTGWRLGGAALRRMVEWPFGARATAGGPLVRGRRPDEHTGLAMAARRGRRVGANGAGGALHRAHGRPDDGTDARSVVVHPTFPFPGPTG